MLAGTVFRVGRVIGGTPWLGRRMEWESAEAVGRAGSELEGVQQALEWCRDGDLLLILTHESRDEVLERMKGLEARGWVPGKALPAE